jgi:hypothetical protein
MKLLKILLPVLLTPTLSSAQSIPAIKAKALDNSEITLPNPGSRQILILVFGFSKKSGELCQVWGKKSPPTTTPMPALATLSSASGSRSIRTAASDECSYF